jgi:hypothetical protein
MWSKEVTFPLLSTIVVSSGPLSQTSQIYVLESTRALIKCSGNLPFKFRLLKLIVGLKLTNKIPMFNMSVDVA